MKYCLRAICLIMAMVAASLEASAAFVSGYADWKKMSEVQKRAYVRGLVDGMMVVEIGNDSSRANIAGFMDCADQLNLTDEMMAEAISEYYKARPQSWKFPPYGPFHESIMKGACLDFINSSRRKLGLQPWTSK
ncbi:MAG: hypothetical protein IOC86_02475 [Aestuariivirga sp.]|nr:hypothetical protein [Aestuariivirga sp.]